MFNLGNMDVMDILARTFILLLVMPLHEFSHAAMAVRLGDDTPIRQGRYTLNPRPHLSLVGSIALFFFGFGWANPVIVNPGNLKKPKRDMAIIAIMGPLSNVFAAFVLIIVIRVVIGIHAPVGFNDGVMTLNRILLLMVQINLLLAAFNLLPIPPLDGSKVLGAFLPDRAYRMMDRYQGMMTIVLLLLLFTGQLMGVISSMIMWMMNMLWRITSPIEFLFGL